MRRTLAGLVKVSDSLSSEQSEIARSSVAASPRAGQLPRLVFAAQVHDFYFYLFAFSRENRFSHEKTSTLLSICRDVFDGDMGTNDPAKHMGTSFERLEGMLLRHAVFRPPKSIGVFDEGDVRSILNFMLHNYYRHWRLYKVCFTRRLQCTFTQVLPFGVEEPAAYRPLVELLPLGEAPPAVLEPEPEPEEEGGEAEDGEATGEEPPADEVA